MGREILLQARYPVASDLPSSLEYSESAVKRILPFLREAVGQIVGRNTTFDRYPHVLLAAARRIACVASKRKCHRQEGKTRQIFIGSPVPRDSHSVSAIGRRHRNDRPVTFFFSSRPGQYIHVTVSHEMSCREAIFPATNSSYDTVSYTM
ncbi:hypothetical protein PHLGIDRAFT_188434 [Phlebiopsis gigantea 11061_1 CR5-6]|uniref:Uncharacterized protein n=1 Tax=Phlebiopsis gigantea (strain 11061_1 CR5-6) TaxID=745531 RepID=A0A0C3NI93_PHLG1|nr:hypothetical protein PHLGIDRAFT_188434 [Phlebiopsis gigantea 11061_1 CR5-6]